MKNILSRIIIAFIIIAVGVWIASGIIKSRREKAEKERKQAEEKARIHQSLMDMIDNNNAVADWKKNFSLGTEIYSIQLEKVLIRSDNRPIFFVASVFDIKREKDQHFVYFDSLINVNPIRFILGCESTLVQRIINAKSEIPDYGTGIFNQYGVIASISSVEKRRIDESDYFIVNGNSIDLLFLGPISLEYYLETRGVKKQNRGER